MTENEEGKDKDILQLRLELFNLKLQKKKFFGQGNKFQSHLIPLLKKKIALLKKKEDDEEKSKKKRK